MEQAFDTQHALKPTSGGAPAMPRKRRVEGFHTRLGGDELAPARARRELAALTADLSPELVDTTRLLVTELVTNSLRHAGADNIELVVSLAPDSLRVEVVNAGAPFVPLARDAVDVPDPGWGLYLVDSLSQSWGVQDDSGWQRVWFELGRN